MFVFVCVCVCCQILSWYLQDEDTFTRIIKAERVVFAAIGFDVQIFTGLSLAHRVRFRLSLDPGSRFGVYCNPERLFLADNGYEHVFVYFSHLFE